MIYTEKAYCHCIGGSAMHMIDNAVLECPACAYKVRFLVEEALPEWYAAEVMESTEFPVCLECGRNMKGCGVTFIKEEGRYFQVIGLVCGPNAVHSKRRIGSYGKEISRNEYAVAVSGAQETLIEWALEGRLLGLDIPTKLYAGSGMKILLDALLRIPAKSDGSREVDLAEVNEGERGMVIEVCEWYANNGLFHNFVVQDMRISFCLDKRLLDALVRWQSPVANV